MKICYVNISVMLFFRYDVLYYLGDKMTFDEKIKELRKNKNITQDELAKRLYVSRTTISKWESGKGYPSIDTLKQLSEFFDVSIDDLLSNDEVLDISKKNIEKNKKQIINLMFSLLDIFSSLLFIIPVFGLNIGDKIVSVGLFYSDYGNAEIVLDVVSLSLVTLFGIITLPLVVLNKKNFLKYGVLISLVLSGLLVLVFLITREVYAGIIVLAVLTIKAVLLLKK